MEVMIILLPLALMLGGAFIAAFIWSTKNGQYDDLETPRHRILLEDIQNKIEPLMTRKEKE